MEAWGVKLGYNDGVLGLSNLSSVLNRENTQTVKKKSKDCLFINYLFEQDKRLSS